MPHAPTASGGTATPAGWSFVPEPILRGVIVPGVFAVEIEIGAGGFRVGGRLASAGAVTRSLLEVLPGSAPPILVVPHGLIPAGAAADLLYAPLATALATQVIAADQPIGVGAQGELDTAGTFRQWRPGSGSAPAGPATAAVGTLITIPAPESGPRGPAPIPVQPPGEPAGPDTTPSGYSSTSDTSAAPYPAGAHHQPPSTPATGDPSPQLPPVPWREQLDYPSTSDVASTATGAGVFQPPTRPTTTGPPYPAEAAPESTTDPGARHRSTLPSLSSTLDMGPPAGAAPAGPPPGPPGPEGFPAPAAGRGRRPAARGKESVRMTPPVAGVGPAPAPVSLRSAGPIARAEWSVPPGYSTAGRLTGPPVISGAAPSSAFAPTAPGPAAPGLSGPA